MDESNRIIFQSFQAAEFMEGILY